MVQSAGGVACCVKQPEPMCASAFIVGRPSGKQELFVPSGICVVIVCVWPGCWGLGALCF